MEKPDIELILNKILEHLNDGSETLENCQIKYSSVWSEVSPLVALVLQLDRVREEYEQDLIDTPLPDVDSHWKHFHSTILEPTEPVPLSLQAKRISKKWIRNPLAKVAVVFIVFGLAFMIFVGAAYASEPGDFFYPSKLSLDSAGILFSFSANDQAQARLEFAERRLNEIASLQKAGRISKAGPALNAYRDTIEANLSLISETTPQKREQLQREIQQQQAAVEQLKMQPGFSVDTHNTLTEVLASLQKNGQALANTSQATVTPANTATTGVLSPKNQPVTSVPVISITSTSTTQPNPPTTATSIITPTDTVTTTRVPTKTTTNRPVTTTQPTRQSITTNVATPSPTTEATPETPSPTTEATPVTPSPTTEATPVTPSPTTEATPTETPPVPVTPTPTPVPSPTTSTPSGGPPTELDAVAKLDRGIELSWIINSTWQEGIQIERKTEADGVWVAIAEVGAKDVSYLDVNVNSDVTYYYRVRVYKGSSVSAYSNEVEVTYT